MARIRKIKSKSTKTICKILTIAATAWLSGRVFEYLLAKGLIESTAHRIIFTVIISLIFVAALTLSYFIEYKNKTKSEFKRDWIIVACCYVVLVLVIIFG